MDKLIKFVLENDVTRLADVVTCGCHGDDIHAIYGILLHLAEIHNFQVLVRILQNYAAQLQSTETLADLTMPTAVCHSYHHHSINSQQTEPISNEVDSTRTTDPITEVYPIDAADPTSFDNEPQTGLELQLMPDSVQINCSIETPEEEIPAESREISENENRNKSLEDPPCLLESQAVESAPTAAQPGVNSCINESIRCELCCHLQEQLSTSSKLAINYSISDCMMYLVCDSNCGKLRSVLAAGLPLDTHDTVARSLIHHAAAGNSTNALQILVDLGADADAYDLQNVTPLMLASRAGGLEAMDLLLRHTQNVNHRDHCDQTALHYACKTDSVCCAERLLLAGIQIQLSVHRETELMVALSHNAEKIVPLLIQSGVDVEWSNRQNNTALHYAARYDCPSTVAQLYQAGAKMVEDRHGYTPIAIAAKNGHHRTLMELLRYYSNPEYYNKQTRSQKTPLQLAAITGQFECVKLLLDAGAKVDYGSDLCSAAQGGSCEVLALFIETYKQRLGTQWYDSSLDCVNMLRMSPLHVAAMNGFDRCIHLLLKENANPCQCMPITGETPLMLAVIENHHRCAQLLINAIQRERSVGLNIVTPKRKTALHYASKQGALECVKLLINAKALLDIKDSQGYTPMLLAVQSGHHQVVKRLLDAGCDVSANKQHGWNGLHLAILNDQSECAEHLLCAGINPNASSWITMVTPAHLATQRGHLKILRSLLKFGARVDAKNDSGCLPIHVAAQYDHAECIQWLVIHQSPIDALNHLFQTPANMAAALGSIHALAILILYNTDVTKINTITDLSQAVNYFECLQLLLSAASTVNFNGLTVCLSWDLLKPITTENDDGATNRPREGLLEYLASPQPVSLQQQCRAVIRRNMGQGLSFINGVPMLPLPKYLKTYVAMKKECQPYACHV